mmetsp:Transcript_25158/g.41394  ORF Transcript_25158/g.41394 Transcript_25158/m.41394 type:complete len:234 (+) Transcript_25158:844-1545(+)
MMRASSFVYVPLEAGSIDCTDTTPHDHAVLRAMRASYDASRDPKIGGDPFCTLFVGRLSLDTTEETLHKVFGQYGRIKRIRLVRHVVTGRSRGYAFVEFDDERDFRDAFRATNHMVIDGMQILVDFERERVMKGWIPRRLGGGLGGKKESGQLRFGGRDRPFKTPLRLMNQQNAFMAERDKALGRDHLFESQRGGFQERGRESSSRHNDDKPAPYSRHGHRDSYRSARDRERS